MRDAAAELASAMGRMDDATLESTLTAIVEARRVMLYGCGREGAYPVMVRCITADGNNLTYYR